MILPVDAASIAPCPLESGIPSDLAKHLQLVVSRGFIQVVHRYVHDLLEQCFVFSHLCDSITYRKYCFTSRLMRARSMRVVIDDTSSLKSGRDSNADACSVLFWRRPVVVLMSTRGE